MVEEFDPPGAVKTVDISHQAQAGTLVGTLPSKTFRTSLIVDRDTHTGEQSQVVNRCARCREVEVEQSNGDPVPEDDVLQTHIVVTNNRTAIGVSQFVTPRRHLAIDQRGGSMEIEHQGRDGAQRDIRLGPRWERWDGNIAIDVDQTLAAIALDLKGHWRAVEANISEASQERVDRWRMGIRRPEHNVALPSHLAGVGHPSDQLLIHLDSLAYGPPVQADSTAPFGQHGAMDAAVPDFVTHYYRAGRAPFLNLSELDGASLDDVVEQLSAEHERGESSRVFGRRYMELRRLTEQRLRELFIRAGGAPGRRAPHYFVLGSSRWYEGLAADMKRVTLALADLPEEATSFTIPDSFTAMGLGERFGLRIEGQPYHGNVYRLSQLNEMVERFGMPVDEQRDYSGYQHGPFEKYVEIQLWDDGPIAGTGWR